MPSQKHLKNTRESGFLYVAYPTLSAIGQCRTRPLGIDLHLNQSALTRPFDAISTWRTGGDRVLAPNCSQADGQGVCLPSMQRARPRETARRMWRADDREDRHNRHGRAVGQSALRRPRDVTPQQVSRRAHEERRLDAFFRLWPRLSSLRHSSALRRCFENIAGQIASARRK